MDINAFNAEYLRRVDLEEFDLHYLRAFEESPRVRDNCAILDSATEPVDTDYYLAADGRSGFAIRADGELVYVFSLVKGRGDKIVKAAKDRGAVYLDCFEGYLSDLYGRHGFHEVKRVPNWTPGGPAVIYAALPGFSDRHGV